MLFRGRKRAGRADDASQHPEHVLFDGLSGLYHAWYFDRRLVEEVARCARYGDPFALVVWEPRMLPGEDLTDEAIARAGESIAAGIRKTDLAGRLSRVRFAALLIEANSYIARTVAYRLRIDLAQRARTGGGLWRGAYAVMPEDGLQFETLMDTIERRLSDDDAAAAAA